MLPRLHLITDDVVLAAPSFAETAESILLDLGDRVALHLRSRSCSGRNLYQLAARLARLPGAVTLINERVDVALVAGCAGVQLPAFSLPVEDARALLGPDRWIGRSVHTLEEARQAEAEGADFLLAGTIYASQTHADAPPRGPLFLADLHNAVQLPIMAIGGIERGRVGECRRAGAFGVAVIRAVWRAPDPLSAARELLAELQSGILNV